MYYTVIVKRIFPRTFIFFLTLMLAACAGGLTLPATPTADSAPNSRPAAPNRTLQKSLPRVCDCVLRFDNLNIEQGLSQSSVDVIFQDSRGFMWFGGWEGLNKYDGYKITVYQNDPLKPNSISNNYINQIAESKNGDLWIATYSGGLCRFNRNTEEFIRYNHNPRNKNSNCR